MSQKIGPRELALRKMTEARAESAELARKADLAALRDKVAAVPVRKPKAARKKRL